MRTVSSKSGQHGDKRGVTGMCRTTRSWVGRARVEWVEKQETGCTDRSKSDHSQVPSSELFPKGK